jgi:hypothetical protein
MSELASESISTARPRSRPTSASEEGALSEYYVARIVEVEGTGIRLQPTEDAKVPGGGNDVNLLALAVALALGHAAYHHHPEIRDAQIDTIDGLLSGEVTMPWVPTDGHGHVDCPDDAPYIVCELMSGGAVHCKVQCGLDVSA